MEWKLETRKIDEVSLNEHNPRTISKKQAHELKKSIQKFGLCQPVVLNSSGKILGGHQRIKVMRSLGYSTVDVYVASEPFTEEEEDELSIRLNKNVGIFDFDVLANCYEPEQLLYYGFSEEEMQIESIPDQRSSPKRFIIKINCTCAEQLRIIEEYIAPLIVECIGASYKVKIK